MFRKIFNLKIFLLGALFTMLFGTVCFASPAKIFDDGSTYTIQEVLSKTNGYNYVGIDCKSQNKNIFFFTEGNFTVRENNDFEGYYDILTSTPTYTFTEDGKDSSGNILYKVRYGSLLCYGFKGEIGSDSNSIIASNVSIAGHSANPFPAPPISAIMMGHLQSMIGAIVKQMGIIIPVGISALCLVVLVPYLIQFLRRFV